MLQRLDFDALMDEAEQKDRDRRAKGLFADFECPTCENVLLLCPVCGVCLKYCHNDYFHEAVFDPEEKPIP
jgi:hypothetical protein